MEILFTGLCSLRSHEPRLTARTSIWMFPIYGMASFLSPLSRLLQGRHIVLRGSIYTCCIFAGEFLSGAFLKKHRACPWDYSTAKYNIAGLIRLDYAPLWFGAGLLFEKLLSNDPVTSGRKKKDGRTFRYQLKNKKI